MENQRDFRGGLRRARTVVLCALMACGGEHASTRTAAQPVEGHSHGQDHGAHHHRFDDAAKWAKVFDDPARDEWQKPARVVEVMAISPGMTVADVGAGTGYFEPHLARAVGPSGKVIAEDVEPDMVRWLADRARRESLGNVEALLGTNDDPKLPAGSVDRVLVVDTWHHIEDRPAFAKKLTTALKPKGAVFVVDFTADSPHGPPQHARLAPEAVASDLAAAGLEASVLKDAGLPNQYVVRGTLPAPPRSDEKR
jgi:ubiquinone/menaquinone biosynthesis C-methylase UbiE